MKTLLSILLIITAMLAGAQDFEHTLSLKSGETSPKADLSAVSWLAGHWRGEAFGGITEELWSPPLGGSMMGAFKLVADDEVVFYELETIMEMDGSLVLRLKHFSGLLHSWEDKEETVDFKLVKVTKDVVYFDGFTLERISDQEINMYVVIEEEGVYSEEKFNYKRVK